MPVASPPSRVSPSAPPLRAAAYWFFVGFSFGTSVATSVGGAVGGECLASALGLDRSLVPLAFNFFGLQVSGRVQLLFSAPLVVVVLGVVASVVPSVQVARFARSLPPGWIGVGVALSLFVCAFASWKPLNGRPNPHTVSGNQTVGHVSSGPDSTVYREAPDELPEQRIGFDLPRVLHSW